VREDTGTAVAESFKDSHNVWLSVAVQSGLIGLAAFAALAFDVCRRAFRRRVEPASITLIRSGLGLALVAALFYQGLSGAFEDARHLWVLIGLIVAVDGGLGAGAAPRSITRPA
jgi:O-antigen ligase